MDISISDFIDSYLDGAADSPNSKISYRTSFNVLIAFMRERTRKNRPLMSDLSERKVREWLLWMQRQRNVSIQTCDTRLSNVRRCLKKACVKMPELSRLSIELENIPKTRDEDYLSRKARLNLVSVPDRTTAKGRTDACMLYMLADTGMSIDSLSRVRLEDINLGAASAYVMHGKDRLLKSPLGKGCRKELAAYIRDFHKQAAKEDLLFSHVVKGETRPFSLKTIGNRMKEIYHKAHESHNEIPDYIAPYNFKKQRKR